ncbi:MAG: hypothetical protein IPH84_06805 [Bacteroidales bacterium]|nr:hypothetical protein [Bacteroidales bacterium]
MKTKLQSMKWLLIIMISVIGFKGWGQSTLPHSICPGPVDYWVVPGNTGNTFNWSITPGVSGTDWTVTPNGNAYTVIVNWANVAVPVTYTVTVSETEPGPNGCTTTQTLAVTVLPAPVLVITNPPAICAPGTVDLTAAAITAGSTLPVGTTLSYWTDAGATIALVNPNAVGTSGTYYIMATTGTLPACTDIEPVVVTINPQPIATISYPGSPYCATGTATVTQTGQAGGTYSSTVGLVIDPATGTIDLVASTAGTYTVTYSFSNGTCSNTTTTSVTINALPVATIAYAGSPYCATGTATVTQTGQAGGTYSSTVGLVIDPATGTIDLVASTAGTYTVTYSFSNGTCSNTTTTSITINALPVATIAYAGSPYCLLAATVTQTGQAGGTYSSTVGLVIDPATGTIDLVASTAGTYTVTYSFSNGTCSNTTTTSVTINALPVATIAYAGSPYCATGTATVTQTGQAGGTYSSTVGLVIDPATGTIDLVASTAGTYTVTSGFVTEPVPILLQPVTINALPLQLSLMPDHLIVLPVQLQSLRQDKQVVLIVQLLV